MIADEVMTGFGRTGRWFGMDHWGVRPDILTAGKGSTSGYVPFGFAAASGEVFDTVAAHGIHARIHVVAQRARRRGRQRRAAAAARGRARGAQPRRRRAGARRPPGRARRVRGVGDVRGLGLMIGIELVRDAGSKEPFPRSERVTERVLSAARDAGLLLYSSTGHVDGTNGDLDHARPAVRHHRR